MLFDICKMCKERKNVQQYKLKNSQNAELVCEDCLNILEKVKKLGKYEGI